MDIVPFHCQVLCTANLLFHRRSLQKMPEHIQYLLSICALAKSVMSSNADHMYQHMPGNEIFWQ